MTEWQMMESAPKDGQYFLGGRWGDDNSFHYAICWYDDYFGYYRAGLPHEYDGMFTHWMPLPKQPEPRP